MGGASLQESCSSVNTTNYLVYMDMNIPPIAGQYGSPGLKTRALCMLNNLASDPILHRSLKTSWHLEHLHSGAKDKLYETIHSIQH